MAFLSFHGRFAEGASRIAPWQDASYAKVRGAYRRLALQLHPDKFESADEEARRRAERRFHRANLAHDVLTDKFKKWQLDNGASVADVAQQERAEAEMAYYATTAPNGYTRDMKTLNGRTGGKLYNPYNKMSKNFDYDPCRQSGPAMEALMGKGGVPEVAPRSEPEALLPAGTLRRSSADAVEAHRLTLWQVIRLKHSGPTGYLHAPKQPKKDGSLTL